ncbi:trk system potassium uptake protein TrkH [Thermoflavimicrobium dichotomicum]|uniref:Trk system potassium uptake protein TrkH n=1 Tax=Thermoflavimicrobium dichotomicum TaxID=46223 RepID=A0A1I3MEB6_9BACL|nr:trk system potassium uptake protein TrkH [Thermoflavimicrobium dichotomicum]
MVKGRFSILNKLPPPQVLVIGFALTILIGACLLTLPVSAEPGNHVSFLDALFTATSAVCVTGLVVVDMATIILGGIGFVVIREIVQYRQTKKVSLHTKLVLTTTAILLVGGTLLILLIEWSNPATLQPLGLDGKILASWFQSVSTRTAGFNTINIGEMYSAALFIMILLMFVGASPSFTGGGIKTTTLASILLAVWNMIRGRKDVVAFRRRIPSYLVYKALSVTVAALTYVIIITLLLTITERVDILTAMFETVSAFGTVG